MQTEETSSTPKRSTEDIAAAAKRKENEKKIRDANAREKAEREARKAKIAQGPTVIAKEKADAATTKLKIDMSKKPPATITLPKPDVTVPTPAEVRKIKNEAKATKPAKDPNTLSVSDVAREIGVDPKRARARLRAARGKATDGRWDTVARGSDEMKALIEIIKEPAAKPTKKSEPDPEVRADGGVDSDEDTES